MKITINTISGPGDADFLDEVSSAAGGETMSSKSSGTSGCGVLGMIFAAVLSWTANGSIWWLILHTVLGWIYVLYRGVLELL